MLAASAALFTSSAFAALPLPAGNYSLLFFQDGEIELNGVGIGETYTGTQDVELRQPEPDDNFDLGTGSSNPEFTIDLDDASGPIDDVHVAIRFDGIFDYIPGGSTITYSDLFVDVDNNSGNNNPELYQLDGDFSWDETTATWNNFGTPNDGINVGDDTVGGIVATLDGQGNKEFLVVTSSVQDWFAGAVNNGWGFIPTGSDGVDIDASENSDPADRPSLYIEFTVPEPSAAPALFGLAALLVARRRK